VEDEQKGMSVVDPKRRQAWDGNATGFLLLLGLFVLKGS